MSVPFTPADDAPRACADSAAERKDAHGLRRELGLRDLVPMQILLVVGLSWPGIAARQGPTHVMCWLIGVALLLLPVAMVVSFCVRIWPQEGGVYQWTKHALGPFWGFLTAWNFGLWGLIIVSGIGILTASALSYALGPSAAWMEESGAFIACLNVGIFAFMLLVNIPGLGLGRWVAHFGTTVMVLVTALMILVVFYHPTASAGHPHVAPQTPFSLAFPALTLMSVNLFSKLAFNGLTGLEQVAVFAGETRDAARSILRSVWIAAPLVALMYILMSGSMLTYTAASKIDLAAPIPQLLAAAFGSGHAQAAAMVVFLGRGAILALAVSTIAQFAVILAETSRLPLVAAWDQLMPVWFTRLHPRYRTPTRSLLVVVSLAVVLALLASVRAGTQEAFQVISNSANVCYAFSYLLMFTVPLAVGTRFGAAPGWPLRLACVSGLAMTLLTIGLSLWPIVEVRDAFTYGLKVAATVCVLNLLGMFLYWRSRRRRGAPP
jgi:amino acid transporter